MKIHIRNIILAATCLLPFAARAQERPLTVCEGKTWNYCIENSGYGHIERIDDLGYHFDGTREADGHTYGVFRDGSGKEAALMRQEGGKVYRNLEPYLREHFNGDEETVLYDFGLKPGDKYTTVGSCDDMIDMMPHVDLTVLSVDTIEVHGQKRIRQRIESEMWNDKHTFTVVEGIGPDYGRLDAPQWGPRNAGFSTSIYHTVNVTDSDGNTVFTERDFQDSAENEFASFVDKRKVWHYSAENYAGGCVESETERPSVRFQKDDVRMGDNDYSALVQINRLGEVTDTVALLRQDGARLYLFNDERFNRSIRTNDGFDNPEHLNKEILIYDFDARPGDSYNGLVCGDGGYEIIQVHVGSVETCCIRGRVFRQQFLIRDNYSGFTDMAIEGIGVSGPGRFFAPYLGDRFAGGYLHPHSELRLREVSDTDGNVIFSQKEVSLRNLEPMLVEGRKWEYRHSGMFGYHNYIETMTLKGDSTINGTAYRVLKSDLDRKFLVREDHNRVFRHNPEDGTETLLYDFNMLPGDSFGYSGHYGQMDAGITVEKIVWEPDYRTDRCLLIQDWNVEIRDEHGNTAGNEKFKVISPLGMVDCGTFADFETGPWPTNGLQPTSLMRVTDADGTVLYYNQSLDNVGVDAINADPRLDSRIYDLNGREIRNPEPGTVYIQGGRKRVSSF